MRNLMRQTTAFPAAVTTLLFRSPIIETIFD
jgi:hypothetical protein